MTPSVPRDFSDLDGPVAEALARRMPLRPLPSLAAALDDYARRVAAGDDRAQKQRLSSYRSALGPGIRFGVLPIGGWDRESRRRIRIEKPGLQQIANDLRRHFAPTPGYVFLDADFTNAHMHIAAARAKDEQLRAALGNEDFYADIARRLLSRLDIDPARARKPVKRALLALLNGGDAETVAGYLAEIGPPVDAPRALERGARLEEWFWDTFRAIGTYKERQIEHCKKQKADSFLVRSITRREVVIDVSGKAEDKRWRTLLAAKWTLVEAEALDYVLASLHHALASYDGRLVLPMYDGVLVEVREDTASGAAVILRRLMELSMQRAGVAGVPATVEVRRRWGEPPAG